MAESTVYKNNVPARTESDVPATRETESYLTPAVDIYEAGTSLMVVADVPGVTRDGLEVDVNDRILTIRGKVAPTERENIISREFGMMNYFRQFRLSDEVDRERIEAALEQGVLTLRLPKAESAQPRRIDVKVS